MKYENKLKLVGITTRKKGYFSWVSYEYVKKELGKAIVHDTDTLKELLEHVINVVSEIDDDIYCWNELNAYEELECIKEEIESNALSYEEACKMIHELIDTMATSDGNPTIYDARLGNENCLQVLESLTSEEVGN